MRVFTYNQFNIFFRIVCVLATFVIVIWWLHKYSLHHTSCSIDVKDYFETEDDVQPAFSICVIDPKLEEKLERFAPGYNKSTYIKFLRGDVYHEELRNLDFDYLRFNWSEYFHETPSAYLVSKNGIPRGRVSMSKHWRYYTSYIGLQSYNRYLTNCLAVEPLSNEVTNIRIRLNGSIFKNGMRPNSKFRVFLHYPQQIIRSYSTVRYVWDARSKNSSYKMNFRIKDVEVLHRNNYRKHSCINDWSSYDKIVLEMHVNKVGCRSPYRVSETNQSICSSKDKMNESLIYPGDVIMKKFDPPCRSLEKIYYTYTETSINEIPKGTFEMKFHFNNRYKEIVQYAQIDMGVKLYY